LALFELEALPGLENLARDGFNEVDPRSGLISGSVQSVPFPGKVLGNLVVIIVQIGMAHTLVPIIQIPPGHGPHIAKIFSKVRHLRWDQKSSMGKKHPNNLRLGMIWLQALENLAHGV
jgi:hypothetical protein